MAMYSVDGKEGGKRGEKGGRYFYTNPMLIAVIEIEKRNDKQMNRQMDERLNKKKTKRVNERTDK